MPIVTLIDTPGAYPGISAEETGQGIAIAVNESTVLTDADIASTVTIAVGGFQGVIEKAAK